MNKYNQSALSNKGRRAIFEEAKQGGVIIQQKTTAGEVVSELALVSMDKQIELPVTNQDGAESILRCVVIGEVKCGNTSQSELIWTGIAWVPVGDVAGAYAKSLGIKQ